MHHHSQSTFTESKIFRSFCAGEPFTVEFIQIRIVRNSFIFSCLSMLPHFFNPLLVFGIFRSFLSLLFSALIINLSKALHWIVFVLVAHKSFPPI